MHEDLPGEQWRAIPGAEGYEVSSCGRVRSYWKKSRKPSLLDFPHLLKSYICPAGYPQFTLHINGVQSCPVAHRLVLEAFVGPRPEGMVCRHLDGNPKNNHLGNLCWGTHQENSEDARRHGTFAPLKGEDHPKSKLTEAKVREIFRLRKSGVTQAKVSQMFGISCAHVSSIERGRCWSHVNV